MRTPAKAKTPYSQPKSMPVGKKKKKKLAPLQKARKALRTANRPLDVEKLEKKISKKRLEHGKGF